MFFMAAFARAEKTYVKDRAECNLSGEQIILDIKGRDLITESPDDYYGDILQIEHAGTVYPVKISDTIIGRYRLLRGRNDLCNKPLALKINNEEIAIFLARDNRPFADTLMVLYYNVRTRAADFVPSKIITRTGIVENGMAYFKLASNEQTERYGTTMIDKNKYNYAEKTLEPWISFDGKNFRLDRSMTYDKFEHRDLLKRTDMSDLSEFREVRYRWATNPTLKRNCLSMNLIDWNCNK